MWVWNFVQLYVILSALYLVPSTQHLVPSNLYLLRNTKMSVFDRHYICVCIKQRNCSTTSWRLSAPNCSILHISYLVHHPYMCVCLSPIIYCPLIAYWLLFVHICSSNGYGSGTKAQGAESSRSRPTVPLALMLGPNHIHYGWTWGHHSIDEQSMGKMS